MKKVILCTLVAICAIGCTSMQHNSGRNSLLTRSEVRSRLQADMKVENIITGTAHCESWFGGIYRIQPTDQTFGAVLQTHEGNISSDQCTRGAIYNALTKNRAEYIVDPKYDVATKREFCLFGFLCLHKIQEVKITGYKARVSEFKNVPLN